MVFTSKSWRLQLVNGSPINPSGHEQIGIWLTIAHWADIPQRPGQGSVHFSLRQTKCVGHSALIVHSGLQFGGIPL